MRMFLLTKDMSNLILLWDKKQEKQDKESVLLKELEKTLMSVKEEDAREKGTFNAIKQN